MSPGEGSGFLRRPLQRRTLVAVAAALTFARPGRAAAQPIVAAASDLKFALEEIAEQFFSQTGESVRLVFGSSGNFARQIRQGAPYALFLSADEDFALALARDGFAVDRGQLYAIGRLVVMAPLTSPIDIDPHLDGIEAALIAGRLQRFAIANPGHAPYGRAAMEALRHRGLWEALQKRLVYGENVAQAVQFVVSAVVDAGIGGLALARAPTLATRQRYAVIPADWHQPLRQRAILLVGAHAVARRFYEWLQSEQARAVLRHYGFVLPGEDG